MTKIKLLKDYASYKEGETLDVTEEIASQLIANNFAKKFVASQQNIGDLSSENTPDNKIGLDNKV